MNSSSSSLHSQQGESAPQGFDRQGWPLPEVRSMMVDNFVRSWLHHWISVIVLFFVSAGLVVVAAILATPTWEGTATVIVQPTELPKYSIAASGTQETSMLQTGMLVRNLAELVHDHNLQYEVIDETKLDDYIQKRTDKWRERIKEDVKYVLMLKFLWGKPPNWRVRAKKELDGNWISIAPSEGTSKLPLYIYGSSPEKTIEVGNAILAKVQEYMDDSMRTAVQAELDTLAGLVDKAEEEVAKADGEINDYRKKLGFFNPQAYANALQDNLQSLEQESNLLAAQITGLDESISDVLKDLEQYDPFIQFIREGTQVSEGDRTSQKIEIELAQLKADREAVLVSKPANSFEVQTLNQKIRSLEQTLEEARRDEAAREKSSETVTRDWDQRYKALFDRWLDSRGQRTLINAKISGVQAAIAKMQENQQTAIEADTVLKQMNRQLQLKLEELNNLTSKQSSFQTMLAQDQIFNGMQVIRGFSVNAEDQPDRPNRLLAAILAIAVGIFTALVLPVAYDYLNQILLSSKQVSTIPGVRLSAIVPKMRTGQMTKSMSM